MLKESEHHHLATSKIITALGTNHHCRVKLVEKHTERQGICITSKDFLRRDFLITKGEKVIPQWKCRAHHIHLGIKINIIINGDINGDIILMCFFVCLLVYFIVFAKMV